MFRNPNEKKEYSSWPFLFHMFAHHEKSVQLKNKRRSFFHPYWEKDLSLSLGNDVRVTGIGDGEDTDTIEQIRKHEAKKILVNCFTKEYTNWQVNSRRVKQDGWENLPEVLSAGGTELDVGASVVVDTGLGQHGVVLNLRLAKRGAVTREDDQLG